MQTPTRRVGALIRIEERTIDYLDIESGHVLLSYKAFSAEGGLVVRAIGSPLTIDPSSCAANHGRSSSAQASSPTEETFDADIRQIAR
jgi:hypothetical protein